MIHMATIRVGTSHDMPRIWLEGKWLKRAGFDTGSNYDLSMTGNTITLKVGGGSRRVSSKKDGEVPVIDINTNDLVNAIGSADTVTVEANEGSIAIHQTHVCLMITSRQMVAREGSLFTGGGFLSTAAALAGFKPVFGVEIDPFYADIYERNHPGAACFNCSVEQVPWEDIKAMRPIGLLTMGIPCEPYSMARRIDRGGQEKRDKTLPAEAHELGDMFYWALRAVEAANPHTVVIEEVPGFLQSGAGYVTQAVLRRMGYNVGARVLDPLQFGELTGRKRAIIVATTYNKVNWPVPIESSRTLGEVLDSGEHEWFTAETKPWLFNHWKAQTAKGNGFEPPKLTEASTKVPTIKKRYCAQQGDNPVVCHPTQPDTYRWFTVNELKKIHGIPASYDLGTAKTTAGEVMGQGVLVSLFLKAIQAVTA